MPQQAPAGWYSWQGEDLLLMVLLQPRASSQGWVGVQDGRMKIRLTAPPVEGQANEQLVAFLAKQFAVPKRQVAILQGVSARIKRVKITAPGELPRESGVARPA